jgi:hypothetical protein
MPPSRGMVMSNCAWAAQTVLVEFYTTGLDVEEVRDDDETCRQRRASAVELPGSDRVRS